jgi:hypothetical protein
MKYVCLVYGEESQVRDLDDRQCAAYAGSLQDS